MNAGKKTQVRVLQELAAQKAEISASKTQNERVDRWKMLNGLRKTRPMVMIDQLPWHELNDDGSLTLVCSDPFYRSLESDLRMTLYKWRRFKADMTVMPYIGIQKSVSDLQIGPKIHEDVAVYDEKNSVRGHKYYDVIPDQKALDDITVPVVSVDQEADRRKYESACEIFDGIIPVKMTGITVHAGIWDRISVLRGVDTIMYDLIDRPSFIHQIVERFCQISMHILDQLEQKGLLDAHAPTIHCTGAHTDELPTKQYDGVQASAADCWSYAMAQLFSAVSPSMHDEFEIQPFKRYWERFGLLYYGCCEPLDRKIDIIRNIKNVRKISISPWADKERAAKSIKNDFVFSNKPNPAFLAGESFDEVMVKKDLKETVRICKEYNTPLELILKDVSTVRYDPKRLEKWEQLAMEAVHSL